MARITEKTVRQRFEAVAEALGWETRWFLGEPGEAYQGTRIGAKRLDYYPLAGGYYVEVCHSEHGAVTSLEGGWPNRRPAKEMLAYLDGMLFAANALRQSQAGQAEG